MIYSSYDHNMPTFEVFLSFPFCLFFIFTKLYTHGPLMRKTFLCISTFLYMTNFFCTRIRTLSLYVTRSIYEPYSCSKIFSFFPTHTCGSYKSFFIYTHCSHKNFFPHIIDTHKNPSIHIFLLHTYINNIFLFSLYT